MIIYIKKYLMESELLDSIKLELDQRLLETNKPIIDGKIDDKQVVLDNNLDNQLQESIILKKRELSGTAIDPSTVKKQSGSLEATTANSEMNAARSASGLPPGARSKINRIEESISDFGKVHKVDIPSNDITNQLKQKGDSRSHAQINRESDTPNSKDGNKFLRQNAGLSIANGPKGQGLNTNKGS